MNELTIFSKNKKILKKGNIHSDKFTFTDSYEDYFEWLVHGFKQGDDKNICFIDLTIIYNVC